VLPRFDNRPWNDKAVLALTLVFATLIAAQFTIYATVLPLISLVLAVMGLFEIRRSNGRVKGFGYIVISIVVSLYFLLTGVMGLLQKFR